MIKEAPFDYDLLATRIGINIENKDYKSALKDCDFIISKDADNYKYYQMRAQLYLKINDKRNSLNDNKVSLELISKEYSKNKENITLLFERASLLALINNMQDALMDYDRVLANFPINYEALKQKARILISQQQWNAAINSYMILSQNYPQEEEFFNNQAIAYLNMGNNAKAMEELDKTIQLNGENCDALFNRSKLKKMMGNEIGSKDDLSTVIKILTDRKNHGQLSNRDLQWLNSLKQTL